MRGIESQAMVLCANSESGLVELVDPPKQSKPGDQVWFQGHEGNFSTPMTETQRDQT